MSRRSFNNKKDSGGGGGASWMTTFADLMSLLLTFFILLYSMSNVDSDKFDDVSQSLQGALGGTGIFENGGKVIVSQNKDGSLEVEEAPAEIDEMQKKLTDYVEENGLGEEVEINMDEKGIYFDIKEAILFDSGSAEIKPGGMEVLKKLTGLVKGIDNDIVIEGHTDNVPIHNSKYSSNWDLSTARAVSVVKYFTEVEKITPGRMSAVGYGEYKPMLENTTPENRTANRRVNLLIIFNESEGVQDGKEK